MFLYILLFLLPAFIWSDSQIVEEVPQHLQQPNSDIHGLFDVVFKNYYVTPRGLLVTDKGVTTQALLNISLDLYKNSKSDWLNKFSVFGGVWNDTCSAKHHPFVGNWVEFDWYAGVLLQLAHDWSFYAEYLALLSPTGAYKTEQNIEFSLTYDDSRFELPVTFNPYVKLFWAVAGDSVVVVGKRGGIYNFEIGLLPTWKLKCYPITFTLPTWINVGPASFWNGGTFGLKNEDSNFGVFSTGLKAVFSVPEIPKRLGNWYLDTGIQYYYLINKNLLQAQKFTLGLSSLNSAHRSFGVVYIGFGIGY